MLHIYYSLIHTSVDAWWYVDQFLYRFSTLYLVYENVRYICGSENEADADRLFGNNWCLLLGIKLVSRQSCSECGSDFQRTMKPKWPRTDVTGSCDFVMHVNFENIRCLFWENYSILPNFKLDFWNQYTSFYKMTFHVWLAFWPYCQTAISSLVNASLWGYTAIHLQCAVHHPYLHRSTRVIVGCWRFQVSQ